MKNSRRFRRIWAFFVVAALATGLAAWEFFGPESRRDAGLGEAAILLTDDGPYPPVLFVEKGRDYRFHVAATGRARPLAGWPGTGFDAAWADPGAIVRLDVDAGELRDGEALGPGGPVVRVVDSLDELAARGEVYYAGLIATEDGLVPEQLRLTEGLKTALGALSPTGPRLLFIEGLRWHLPAPEEYVAPLLVDVPAAGVYDVVCEQGCGEGRWPGGLRVEDLNSEVPWVESRDTDAAAEIGRRAPDFALYDAAGRVVQLSDYVGVKPVFINFWATWCPPCEREMPAMQALYDERDGDVEILAVNYLEHRRQVTAFLDERGLRFPALLDVAGDVNRRYGVWSYPTSVFIDRDGVVRGRFIGELSRGLMEEFADAIIE